MQTYCLNTKKMCDKCDNLLKLFEVINEANIKAGDTFQVTRLAPLLSELRSGVFFSLPADEQITRLGAQCEAYVGRGEIMWRLVDQGFLPSDFGDTMKIGFWRYVISLDIPEAEKNFFIENLARLLKK
jgi:hypothetical protein